MADAVQLTVPDVIARMRAIEASAAAADGVVCFARLYREVTEGVNAELEHERFADRRFLAALDIEFAGLFFAALDAHDRDPATLPRAWVPLFEARNRPGVAPLQFALAGMNAHINRDLPLALATTWGALTVEPQQGSPQHADYLHVNDLLGTVERRVKSSYLTGWIARLDRLLHRVHRIDDVLAMWNVEKARDAAWTNGETLWALRDEPALAAAFVDTLDRTVGFAGRGLLVPTESWLRRLARHLS